MTAPKGGSVADLYQRFTFHPATNTTGPMHDEVRQRCYALALALSDLLPECRERSLAITKIEESMHWGNAAIAIHNGGA